ncbi:MAG TPA: L-ribulose-5-phosphate 4-epimerase [Candidatus Limnocylindria bacterium]|nr:L-ribulose-5-phosphate 4-epimerase [Candidatus Limnocylindria bacterium]
MLEALREAVLLANLDLPRQGLVKFTWGNVSGRDPESGLMVIKPSGVAYDGMTARDMVVCDLDGKVVEGGWRPSSDTPTHAALYRAFPEIMAIVHTHSAYATAWAQAGMDIPLFGTTHADHFSGPIPCARALTDEEIAGDYELNTGLVIIETLRARGIHPLHVPAMLCAFHGAFAWGASPREAAVNAAVLEEVAHIAMLTRQVSPGAAPAPDALSRKHFLRKHGENAYYGQDKGAH